MKRNGDVMRADRLKQVMQEIDSTFDEKNLRMAKFSRFVTEAAQRGLLHVTKLENGQLEVDLPRSSAEAAPPSAAATVAAPVQAAAGTLTAGEREAPPRDRGRRGRRDGGREVRGAPTGEAVAASLAPAAPAAPGAPAPVADDGRPAATSAAATSLPSGPTGAAATALPSGAQTGERLTRVEAFDLLRRAVEELNPAAGRAVPASQVRVKARALLGRDSETLSERHFARILQDAHDADVIDLRRRGDDFDVARVVSTASVADQLKSVAAAASSAGGAPPATPASRLTTRSGRTAFGKKRGEAPPDILSIGVVEFGASRSARPSTTTAAHTAADPSPAAGVKEPSDGKKRARSPRKKVAPRARAAASSTDAQSAPRKPARKRSAKPRPAAGTVSPPVD
jgi:hypothetical protein